jgi:hypothetical protein
VNVPGSGNPTQLQKILTGTVTGSLTGVPGGGLAQPTGRSNPAFMTNLASKTTYKGQNISGPNPYQNFPYTQQWNAALSHQFKGNWMAEIGYAALQGTNLPGLGSRNIDQLPDQYDSLGTALSVNAACPAANNLVISAGQCLRPYPYYNNVQDAAASYAKEKYSSMQLRAQKRMGAAGVIMGNYTWAKNMGNTDTQNGFVEYKATKQGGSGNGGVQNWNNLNGEYSLISYDVTNRATISYVLDLPMGKGQKYANSLNGVGNALVSGWGMNGITIFQSGFPVFLSTTTQNKMQSSFGAGTTRPNMVPGCNPVIGGSGLNRVNAGGWFNVGCFSYAGDYAFGNEPRVDPSIRADGVKNFDFSLLKTTSLHESTDLEFRAEFFNIFNRVQFAPPSGVAPVSATCPVWTPTANATNTNCAASTTYGTVAYQVNKPRQIQLSLRLNF